MKSFLQSLPIRFFKQGFVSIITSCMMKSIPVELGRNVQVGFSHVSMETTKTGVLMSVPFLTIPVIQDILRKKVEHHNG